MQSLGDMLSYWSCHGSLNNILWFLHQKQTNWPIQRANPHPRECTRKHEGNAIHVHYIHHKTWWKCGIATGSIYTLGSSLPHWSHFSLWGYNSCSELNLAANATCQVCQAVQGNCSIWGPGPPLVHSYTLHVGLCRTMWHSKNTYDTGYLQLFPF